MEDDNFYYNNMTTNIQVLIMIIIFLPFIAFYVYVVHMMYDITMTFVYSGVLLVVFHLSTLLLMNTPVVIRPDRISVPLRPTNYVKRTRTFYAKEIDSITYNKNVFKVRCKDGFHRSFKKNFTPSNSKLEESVEKFCINNSIPYIIK